jgi:hypothetical protein
MSDSDRSVGGEVGILAPSPYFCGQNLGLMFKVQRLKFFI